MFEYEFECFRTKDEILVLFHILSWDFLLFSSYHCNRNLDFSEQVQNYSYFNVKLLTTTLSCVRVTRLSLVEWLASKRNLIVSNVNFGLHSRIIWCLLVILVFRTVWDIETWGDSAVVSAISRQLYFLMTRELRNLNKTSLKDLKYDYPYCIVRISV